MKIGAVRITLRRLTNEELVEDGAGRMTDSLGKHDQARNEIAAIVAEVAHLLPAQGPITVFIHHNTLHAFEEQPFEEAVVRAGRLFGCEPFLPEARYRAKLAAGRIGAEDIRRVLGADLGERGAERIAGAVTRFDLRERILRHGIPLAEGRAIVWLIRETGVLDRFRSDLPADAREELGKADERKAVRDLWTAAVGAARTLPAPVPEEERRRRHREFILLAGGGDTDGWVHPLLIRFVGTFLDQGLAYWPMPHREEGLYRCFLRLHGRLHASPPDPCLGLLSKLAREDDQQGRGSEASIEHSLDVLGVPRVEWRTFLTDCALPIRGWAGMVRQLEERPDRAPVSAPPASLADFLAVRLLADRAAIEHLARERLGYRGPLRELRAHLGRAAPKPASTHVLDRAWELFHLAQLCGLDAARFEKLSPAEIAQLQAELTAFDEVGRRRLLHLAYEHRLRRGFYDAVASRPPRIESEAPRFQAIFCIDEREESIRRHLEEMEPSAETLGAAGFFGVAMLYKGAEDAHPRPLCPVAIRPAHRVEEIFSSTETSHTATPGALRRFVGRARRNLLVGSHTLVRGTLVMTILGSIAAIPLVLRVLWPRLLPRLVRLRAALVVREPTRLLLDAEVASPAGVGFSKQEMAGIVRRLLTDVGIADRLAPLLLIVGHGSTSLNNPHESAHDCGACGGGRGGPNARAFAQMANDPEVRRLLAVQGLRVPPETWFVGAEHNSCNDDVEYFDTDLVPAAARWSFEAARAALRRACRRNAHERCRRFESAPAWYSSPLALAHVQARAADLAEPRPEFGHATNAYCLIGRRARTRGLFLDRRAFLVSYDPTRDDAEGSVLARLLAATVPIVAGINLEYYFGYVDPTGYGSGTKLPHNVASLLGVMDGARSDLRTGLPWQMVEIHEPVRLAIVVEARPEVLEKALAANSAVQRLVRNRWVYMAALDPESNRLSEIGAAGFEPHRVESVPPEGGRRSRDWYQGERGHLPIAAIGRAAS